MSNLPVLESHLLVLGLPECITMACKRSGGHQTQCQASILLTELASAQEMTFSHREWWTLTTAAYFPSLFYNVFSDRFPSQVCREILMKARRQKLSKYSMGDMIGWS